jgi:hypothetical protein
MNEIGAMAPPTKSHSGIGFGAGGPNGDSAPVAPLIAALPGCRKASSLAGRSRPKISMRASAEILSRRSRACPSLRPGTRRLHEIGCVARDAEARWT